jgi:hypothetical protein
VEARTGAGGGYNERENVEYIEREESDDEFDEVGELLLPIDIFSTKFLCVVWKKEEEEVSQTY